MIDTSNAKWNLSKEESFAVEWFNDNGFSGKIEKQFVSKTIFCVEKDGVSDRFELAQGVKGINMKSIMSNYAKNFETLQELIALRKKLHDS